MNEALVWYGQNAECQGKSPDFYVDQLVLELLGNDIR